MIRAALILGLALCLTHPCGPARADQRTVTPDLVTRVQDAIRWREPAWNARQAEEAARQLNRDPRPRELLAIAVLESALDLDAQAWYVLHGRVVVDVGLMGVHCVVGRKGTCTNWPVRGLRPTDELRTFEANIGAARRILAKKRRHGRTSEP